jgi:protoheme IX farnesyltransferase
LPDTAHESILAAPDASLALSRHSAGPVVLSDYWSMTKPDVSFLIAVTTAAAFYMASSAAPSRVPLLLLLHTLIGTVLVASGAAALNQWREFPFDARMRRTGRRPVAAGRIDPNHALWFGALLSLAGLGYLFLAAGVLPALLAFATHAGYLGLYTPLKRLTPFCTLVGAISGAAPTLIGWSAARGHLDPHAWTLFWIVFLWQFPHFMSIAWMYRDDYDRAGYLVLPDNRTRVLFITVQTLLPLAALLPVSLLPVGAEEPGVLYSIGALALTLGFLYFGAAFTVRRSGSAARRLLTASIIYLPALLALIILLA